MLRGTVNKGYLIRENFVGEKSDEILARLRKLSPAKLFPYEHYDIVQFFRGN